jgi:hypothetical protein
MGSSAQRIAFLGGLLAALVAAQNARADEQPNLTDRTPSDAGADDPDKRVASDAGVGQMSDLAPAENQLPSVDAGLAGIGGAVAHSAAGSDAGGLAHSTSRPGNVGETEGQQILPVHVANPVLGGESSKQGEDLSVIATAATPPPPKRLPIFGVMADVGVPDGLIGSLAIRPRKWVRFSAGGGTNSISYGWRTGVTLLPFGQGPSASLEYGGYQDGNANALAKKLMGEGFNGSPVLERVGYQYLNAHLGLDFGSRRFVFFIHGGVSVLRGQLHNLDAALAGAGATEVLVRQDPNAKAVGPSVKLGFIGYVW